MLQQEVSQSGQWPGRCEESNLSISHLGSQLLNEWGATEGEKSWGGSAPSYVYCQLSKPAVFTSEGWSVFRGQPG